MSMTKIYRRFKLLIAEVRAVTAEAVYIKKIVIALLKKLPLPLFLALADGKLTPKEIKDLVDIATTTVAEELSKSISENLKDD